MAIVDHVDGGQVRGKLNKKSNQVHRITNGREHVYTIEKPYEGAPSKAQKAHRSVFGQTTAIVNRLMADPVQVAEWTKKMEEYNRSLNILKPPFPKRFVTVRAYAHFVISNQLKQTPAAKRRYAKLPLTLPKNVKLQIKSFAELTAAELYEILKARFSVFVTEQHIHYLDEDNIDYLATHFSLLHNGKVIAYARLFPHTQKEVLCVGRMLTTVRGKGYAKYLMAQVINEARARKAETLRLHAQLQVVPFYQHLGFHTVGESFMEAGIQHVTMELPLI